MVEGPDGDVIRLTREVNVKREEVVCKILSSIPIIKNFRKLWKGYVNLVINSRKDTRCFRVDNIRDCVMRWNKKKLRT